MLRITGPYVAALSGGRTGFQDVNPPTVPNGTQLMAAWHTDVQENIAGVIEGTSITLSDSDATAGAIQLLQGVRRVAASNLSFIASASGGTTQTLGTDSVGRVFLNAAAGPLTLTLPAAGAVGGAVAGVAQSQSARLRFYRTDTSANVVTINAASGDALDIGGATTTALLVPPLCDVELFSDGVHSWFAAVGGVGVNHGFLWFTTPGTSMWTPPPGVYRVRVTRCVGGGAGGGGAGAGAAAGGGGGAGLSGGTYSVDPTVPIPVTVGAGGAGGAPGSNGAAGGTSSFGSFCSSTGGLGGYGASSGISSGGNGGVGSGGNAVNIPGGDGTAGVMLGTTPFSGAGGPTAVGTFTPNSLTTGTSAMPGAGGSGGAANAGGGEGGSGYVVVEW